MANTALTSIGVKALAASYAGLQTTGQNIANASVAGYSRQSVVLAPSLPQFSGSGYFGRGVDVVSVERAHDAFLTREATGAGSVAAMDAARLAQLTQLETQFPTGEQGLGHASTQFFNALSDLTTQPADASTRQVVLARAGDLVSQFQRMGAGFDTLQAGVTAGLKVAVDEVNAMAQNVASLNQRIIAAGALGHPPNDLLDQRDQLIQRLAQHLQLTRADADDGSVSLFIAGGQNLVLGATANKLSIQACPGDPSRSALAIADGPTPRLLSPDTLGGGDIAGLLQFQDDDLMTARRLLNDFAEKVCSAVNQQQAMGLTPGGTAGQVMFVIAAQPVPLNASHITLAAGFGPGDIAAASQPPAPASSNGNAIALLALRDSAIVDGRTPSDAYAEAMTTIGVRVQSARTSSGISAAAAAQAEQARAAVAGVNLDEEAARLIQYQQSYQAAAKMLQVAQSLFDTLLQAAGR
ncbi:MAG: flagellar hook-associated protein FlgK [Proteobacteria bacterium]|nr:flagellar hook-associated protein FlgK [Pseudomonadota bacterium]